MMMMMMCRVQYYTDLALNVLLFDPHEYIHIQSNMCQSNLEKQRKSNTPVTEIYQPERQTRKCLLFWSFYFSYRFIRFSLCLSRFDWLMMDSYFWNNLIILWGTCFLLVSNIHRLKLFPRNISSVAFFPFSFLFTFTLLVATWARPRRTTARNGKSWTTFLIPLLTNHFNKFFTYCGFVVFF